MTCGAIAIVIVSDIRLYREGLVAALAGNDRIEVRGGAPSWSGALAMIARLQPQVVLVDMMMPDAHAAIGRLKGGHAEVRVVSLTVPEIAESILACAEAGAGGYVSRNSSLDELVNSIEGVVRGEFLCRPQIVTSMAERLAALATGSPAAGMLDEITSREREVLLLLSQGMSNKEIARKLNIAISTVKHHVHKILQKLKVSGRHRAAARIRSLGIGVDVGLMEGS